MAARNLINIQSVSQRYGTREVLENVTLGVQAGERIGVVGRNGDGKSTLMRIMAQVEEPASGLVVATGGLQVGLLGQHDNFPSGASLGEVLVGDRAEHEWAGNTRIRRIFDGLLGGVTLTRFANGIDTIVDGLSGGERRRIALAKLLLDDPELILLDEPTNHLDVEGVDWLAKHLNERRGSLVVITHDRWFLDAVCTHTWEVVDREVHQYEGGYAAYVLARAERDRQSAARESRRQNLLRKELAWLQRGAPARTSKPRFRVDAANALIADEPAPRNNAELLQFATKRLGSKVLEAHDLTVQLGERKLLNNVTWRIGPGDRIGLVGVNGSGKTTLFRAFGGELEPTSGRIETGSTVNLAYLSQHLTEIDSSDRVIESLEAVRQSARTGDGYELSASQMCERFGFVGGRSHARVGDLSGGERRRLQLMRLMMTEPNVLLLDEPTNDLDIDTLTALEDLLDSWPGTLLVISHDRYFIERVCENVYALSPEGDVVHLPGGIDQYLAARDPAVSVSASSTLVGSSSAATSESSAQKASSDAAQRRAATKTVQRLERQLERMASEIAALETTMAESATDHERLRSLSDELSALRAKHDAAETEWLEAMEIIDG